MQFISYQESSYNLILLQKYKTYQLEKLPSQLKLQIYSQFLKYAQKMNLFNYAILQKGKLKNHKYSQLSKYPSNIYSSPQLQLIYTIYQACNANYNFIAHQLKKRGYFQSKFQSKQLQFNLKNLQLIGLFRCYKKSIKCKGGKGKDWETFIKDQIQIRQKICNWDPYLMKILMKIAVRNDALTIQIKNICSKLGRTYSDQKITKKKINPQEKDISIPQQKSIIQNLTKQLINILKTKKQIKKM